MKKTILLAVAILLCMASCKNKQSANSEANKKATEDKAQTAKAATVTEPTTTLSQFAQLYAGEKLPQEVDTSLNVDSLSVQDLRLLRNYVYAIHGFYSMEAEINSYFTANTDWYWDLVYKLSEDDKLPLNYEDVTLTKEEQSFVDRIDERIAKLQESTFVKQGKYTLGNSTHLANQYQFQELTTPFMDKLAANNFVITPSQHLQLFHIYEENDYRQVPSFITTDLFLQAFHMYFSYTLKTLEQQQFIPLLEELCLGLYNECIQISQAVDNSIEIKERALYNAVFYAIPYNLLTGKELEIPAKYQSLYKEEIANIRKEEDNISRFLSFTDAYFPYSLFKPRGHYTRKPEMKAYFKAMMWLQTAPFCLDDEEQFKHTIFSAVILNTARSAQNKRLIDIYNSIYEPIVFLIGLPDNLSVMDIVDHLSATGVTSLPIALSEDHIADVNVMLTELSKTRNVIKPKIEVSCPDKINFMPQRYLIDNDVLQNLVDITPNSNRPFPKGLDVFAAFGSNSAMELLNNFHKEPKNWEKYPAEMQKMKQKFNNYNQWDSSVYNKWIQSLIELQKPDKSYPNFMQTAAWDLKNLNTSLASWAELKHDAILYGEQPMGAECGGGDDLPVPIVKGYVEPNIKFWNTLSELVSLTGNLLKKHQLFTPDLKGKTEQLESYIEFMVQTTRKELNKEPLVENEYRTIQHMGSNIEYFTLSVIDPDLYLPDWNSVKGPDRSIAVVADIYTRNILECQKCGILHVATGNANSIYVMVEIDGFLHLTRGATFSYYEFVQPVGTRLTDEEWQKMLENKKAPAIPAWMKSILITPDNEPKVDERVFYSSGC